MLLLYFPLLVLGYLVLAVFLLGVAVLALMVVVGLPAAAFAFYERRFFDGLTYAAAAFVGALFLLPLLPL